MSERRELAIGQGYCEKHKSKHALLNDGYGGCMMCRFEATFQSHKDLSSANAALTAENAEIKQAARELYRHAEILQEMIVEFLRLARESGR